jgi:hypothetical protein
MLRVREILSQTIIHAYIRKGWIILVQQDNPYPQQNNEGDITMAHQISASQIRPGSTIILRGKIEYARVRSLMGPEDIDKLNETRRAKRKPGAPFYPLDRNKPLTRLSLSNVEVVFKSPDGQPDLEEYYVYERLFQTPDKPELGNRWSIDNKGNRLPVLLKVVDGKAVQITDDEIPASTMSMPTEPARDQLVTVVLNVYSSGMNANNGIGLQTIIFDGEPEWFTGGNSAVNNNALAALGITLSGPIVAQEGVVVNEPTQQVAAPVAAPVAPAVAQPVAPAVPVVAAAPVVQQAAPQNTVVDATSGLAMPAPVTQAVAPATAPAVQVVAPATPNPQAAQILNAVQQQAPVQADPASAFGVTPEAQPQPVAPEASVDSPWAI